MHAQAGAAAASRDPNLTLDLTRPYDGLPRGGLSSLIIGNKRKMPTDEGETTLQGGDRSRITVLSGAEQSLKRAGQTPEFIRPAVVSPALATSQVRLAVPRVRTFVNRAIDAVGRPLQSTSSSAGDATAIQDTVFEARNSRAVTVGDREPTRLSIAKGAQVLWIDFLPKPVLLVTGNSNFWCAACEDGSLHIYSPVGQRILNALVVEAQPCFLDCRGWWLMCISAVGVAHVW